MSSDEFSPNHSELPKDVTQLFWNQNPRDVSWDLHRDWVIGRVLSAGPWSAIVWLRRQLGDRALCEWIVHHEGRGLSARQIRFWQVVLEIPEEIVDEWLKSDSHRIWNQRVGR